MIRGVIAGLAVMAVAMVMSCSDDGSASTATVRVGVTAASDIAEGIAKAVATDTALAREMLAALNITVPRNGAVSFTPESYKVEIQNITLLTGWGAASSGEYMGMGRELTIPINSTIELVGRDRSSLLAQNSLTVDSTRFGRYVAVKVAMGNGVTISGTLSVDDTTYVLTDFRLALGSGYGYRLADSQQIVIDSGSIVAVEMIFDAEHSAALSRTGSFPTNVKLTDSLYVGVGHPAFLPYVGISSPSIRTFTMTVAGLAPSADTSKFHFKGLALFDSSDALVGVSWQIVYRQGFTFLHDLNRVNPPISPIIVRNPDGTWDVGTDMRYIKPLVNKCELRLTDLAFTTGATGHGWIRSSTDSSAVTWQIRMVP